MHEPIKESDWRIFRKLKPVALERACQAILAEVTQTASNQSQSWHQRYLAIYDLIQKRDKELGSAFDDVSRSKAIYRLATMYRMGLIKDEELAEFSDETQGAVNVLSGRGA
jgi:hypothetical protein